MKIFKRNSGMFHLINIREYQLSIHFVHHGEVWWGDERGICFEYKKGDIASIKYLSSIESALNEIKRKQDENNYK